jgi:predicted nucleic acid-binding Zn ribbon protein
MTQRQRPNSLCCVCGRVYREDAPGVFGAKGRPFSAKCSTACREIARARDDAKKKNEGINA